MKIRHFMSLSLALLVSTPSTGAVISQSDAWGAALGAPSTITLAPFDPTLGTLTRVDVVLSGQMSVQAFASPFPNPQGGFLPYSFLILSKLDTLSPGGTGFDFGGEAKWLTNHTVQGNGNNVVAVSSFELTFEFGDLSDLVGFTLPDGVSGFTQPPITINARRSDFIEDLVNQLLGVQQQFFVPEFPQVVGAPVPVTITALDFNGLMRLDYIYEARQDVPEPAGTALLGLALAIIVARRRRQFARN